MTSKELVGFQQSEDDTDEGGSTGGIRPIEGEPSVLYEETREMENARRLQEQEGHKQFAKVNQRERSDNQNENSLENENLLGPKAHPYLDSQRFDGIDPNLNPEPDIGTDARREFDNERREQDKEKQLRLGNMPKMGKKTAPEFKPG